MTLYLFFISSIFLLSPVIKCHSRWKYPRPRDANDDDGNHIQFINTENKNGPCGVRNGQWGFGTVVTFNPGWNTVVWEESISHLGSPFRISLLDENDLLKIVLLDHIPHNDESKPNKNNENTYTKYNISIKIPNINCPKCSLQLLNIMTDKTTKCNIPVCRYDAYDSACKGSTDLNSESCQGAPNDNVCIESNECFSNYHSCADIIINGKKRINDFNEDGQPSNWPYRNRTMYYYSSESARWNNSWLQNIPKNFTKIYPNNNNNSYSSTTIWILILVIIILIVIILLIINFYYRYKFYKERKITYVPSLISDDEIMSLNSLVEFV